MIQIKDIKAITKNSGDESGYTISFFSTDKTIELSKKRTVVGLLLLLKYQTCTEADLTGTNGRLSALKSELIGKDIPSDLIKDRYGDANKPFSELWTEEMFSFIHASDMKGSREYVLDESDQDKLFEHVDKSKRISISKAEEKIILERQAGRCNICGAQLKSRACIDEHTFEKDRVTLEIDHRIPVDRGGKSVLDNYQALCHYCNKCKRQMCYLCDKKQCDTTCALVNPENYNLVIPTGEDISDRKKTK